MYFVGFCRVCEHGLLGWRICGQTQAPLIICDECEAIWKTPDTLVPAMFPGDGQLPCSAEEVWASGSHWASADEIDAHKLRGIVGKWPEKR